MIGSIQLEVCCGSYRDCLIAAKHHADRIELNSALELGGLTPSRETFISALELNIPLAVMIRPRPAGFCYDLVDFELMLREAKWFAQHGAAAIVFGFLNADASINVERTAAMVAAIAPIPAVFHKAFDSTVDLENSLQQLIALRVRRVLCGGGVGDLMSNVSRLAKLQQTFGQAIELLVGGGVRLDNVQALLEATQIHQVHMTAKEIMVDPSTQVTAQNPDQGHSYIRVSDEVLGKMITLLEGVNYDH